MKKLLIVLALTLPLMAQEKGKEEEKESKGAKVVRHIQDVEWRKFEAAHRRAHSKRGSGEECCSVVKKPKRENHWLRNAVIITGVGVIGYYIGLNERKKGRKGGMKRPTWMPDREKK